MSGPRLSWATRYANVMAMFHMSIADVRALPLRTGLALEQQAGRLRRERVRDLAIAVRIGNAEDFAAALETLGGDE